MALKPYTETQKTRIVNNVIKACADIEALNKTGYSFIYTACGFIAHYNLNGFIGYYKRYSLEQDLADNARMNMWNNFQPSDDNYEYYMSRKDIYQRILARLAAGQFMRDHLVFVHIQDNVRVH